MATTTVGTPLEKNPGKLNAAQWKEYQVQTAAYAKDLATKSKFLWPVILRLHHVAQEKKVVAKLGDIRLKMF